MAYRPPVIQTGAGRKLRGAIAAQGPRRGGFSGGRPSARELENARLRRASLVAALRSRLEQLFPFNEQPHLPPRGGFREQPHLPPRGSFREEPIIPPRVPPREEPILPPQGPTAPLDPTANVPPLDPRTAAELEWVPSWPPPSAADWRRMPGFYDEARVDDPRYF